MGWRDRLARMSAPAGSMRAPRAGRIRDKVRQTSSGGRTDSIRPRVTGLEGASLSQGRFIERIRRMHISDRKPTLSNHASFNASSTRPLRCVSKTPVQRRLGLIGQVPQRRLAGGSLAFQPASARFTLIQRLKTPFLQFFVPRLVDLRPDESRILPQGPAQSSDLKRKNNKIGKISNFVGRS